MTNISLKGKGLITLETDGLPPDEVARLMRIMDRIVRQGVLSVRSSYMTLHFDDQGEIATIEILRRWKAKDMMANTPL